MFFYLKIKLKKTLSAFISQIKLIYIKKQVVNIKLIKKY